MYVGYKFVVSWSSWDTLFPSFGVLLRASGGSGVSGTGHFGGLGTCVGEFGVSGRFFKDVLSEMHAFGLPSRGSKALDATLFL